MIIGRPGDCADPTRVLDVGLIERKDEPTGLAR